ncbi:MAG: hydroxyethylthiazole kinase [Veillonellaceae bacterium]|nr:hydroxyethylthiazole kinase [Veillonellaceae bacterium]
MENLANKICQPTKAELLSQLEPILTYIQQEAPLIHCITNPISINDCANILLAIGARPIMAEHPDEVAEITAIAKGLALNLGNITDARMASMKISAGAAKDKGIPFVLDLVGLSCSRLRQKYAKELLQIAVPDIIKGNISELRTLLGLPTTPGMGVEAGQKEMVTKENALEYARIFQKQAREYHALLLATGPIDLVVSSEEAYIIANGSNALASITATGCMNNVLAGACLAGVHGISSQATNNTLAAILSCLLLGIAGENIQDIYLNQGPGSFHYSLMDSISKLTPQTIAQQCNIKKLI